MSNQTNKSTLHGKLVAMKRDWMNYVTLVFENLDSTDPNSKYVMCTVFPNWDQESIEIGDEGFVTVQYVNAGDTWWDGHNNIPYRYDGVHFLKFVSLTNPTNDIELIL